MAEALAWMREALQDPPQLVTFMAVNVLVNSIFFIGLNKVFGAWSKRQSWWARAGPLQAQQMGNFGYPEEAQTPDAILEAWSFVLVMSIHHTFCGFLTVPVLLQGWEGAGPTGQLCFYFGLLIEMGFDLYDVLKATFLRFCPATCPCLTPVPPVFWVLSICHHSLSVILVLPMLQNYASRWELHALACSLLFAAGIAAATGAYKFTLDTNTQGGFRAYKMVVIFQFVMIWYTRAILWFQASISLLMHFWAVGDFSFFWIGTTVVSIFSLFNMATVADATTAAIKWLPRPMPSTEEEKMVLEQSKSATSITLLTRGSASFRNISSKAEGLRDGGVEI